MKFFFLFIYIYNIMRMYYYSKEGVRRVLGSGTAAAVGDW